MSYREILTGTVRVIEKFYESFVYALHGMCCSEASRSLRDERLERLSMRVLSMRLVSFLITVKIKKFDMGFKYSSGSFFFFSLAYLRDLDEKSRFVHNFDAHHQRAPIL